VVDFSIPAPTRSPAPRIETRLRRS